MDHPPVRSRGARRQRRQAARRRGERRAERRGRAAAGARLAARRRDRLRHESALRRFRSPTTWPPARSTRRCATAWPSAPIRARIAILDNFCWGDCERPETLGSLVRAALACHDVALALGTPFISGKDSLNNEFSYTDASGQRQTIAIPPSLLISALGQIDDVSRVRDDGSEAAGQPAVSRRRDARRAGRLALRAGERTCTAARCRRSIRNERAQTFAALHRAIQRGLVRACHDLSEGGLAVAAAEMAFAGGLGARIDVGRCQRRRCVDRRGRAIVQRIEHAVSCAKLQPAKAAAFEQALAGIAAREDWRGDWRTRG